MADSTRTQELIQKYLDGRASSAEMAELESLLQTDSTVARSFVDAARLHAGLAAHFRKQFMIDQVASLVKADQAAQAALEDQVGFEGLDDSSATAPVISPRRAGSTFVPTSRGPAAKRRRKFPAVRSVTAHRGKWVAAIALLVALGAGLWFLVDFRNSYSRLISGRVTVDGLETTELPQDRPFVVAGPTNAVVRLGGGAHVELEPATLATIRRGQRATVVQLETGGGEFQVDPDYTPIRIETPLGIVTTSSAQVTVTLVTRLPASYSPTTPVTLPRLVVAVAHGVVTVERGGKILSLTAGQREAFVNAT
ncbi:MAG: hypothetical protein ACT4QC_02635 [Planctomycetaceae bacterium]